MVPDELLERLPAEQTPESLPADASAPPEPRWSAPAFSLFALVSALTRPGGSLEDEVRAWSEEPGGWDWDARWTFFRHLALGAGWLVHRADGVLAPAPGLPRLLDEPATLAERGWRAYLRDRSWSELPHAGLPDLPEELREATDLVDTMGLRRAMVDVVEQLPEGGWLRVDALSALAAAHAADAGARAAQPAWPGVAAGGRLVPRGARAVAVLRPGTAVLVGAGLGQS